MEQTLGYLRETLSNYNEEHGIAKHIYKKLIENKYKNEEEFVKDLSEKEIDYLNHMLPDEIEYALDAQDYKRVYELNEVYELLY
jgi:galactose mutarotase-like enzyme